MSTKAIVPSQEKESPSAGGFGREFPRWISYFYFLRFSLFLWIFPGVMIGLRYLIPSIASGLLVPEFLPGYLCVAFFSVSTGFASLVIARLIVINGPERFDADAPGGLNTLLEGAKERWEWIAPAVSQLWSAVLFLYLIGKGPANGLAGSMIFWGCAAGSALAFVFWYAINAWYYLAYQPRPVSPGAAGPRQARTILFPRRMFFLRSADRRASLETARVRHWFSDALLSRLARLFSHTPGYAEADRSTLYEGHAFSLCAAAGFVAIYLLIWPLTAPVPARSWAFSALAAALIVVLLAVHEFWTAKAASPLLAWKIVLSVAVLAFWASVLWVYLSTSAERLPILAVVLLMATAVIWILSSFGFLLDRYRVPVLTGFLVVVGGLHAILPHNDDHYFSTAATAKVAIGDIQTPAQILSSLRSQNGPLVIVTATGGGLHASAWTAAVLAELEREFAERGTPLHTRLLLASTVSGGSEGLNAYLHAIHDTSIDSEAGRLHMQQVAQCSGLEAVGWGLAYYDLPKTLLPLGPIFPVSSGESDLDTTPRFKDRTWALRKAFERNQSNLYCEDVWERDVRAMRSHEAEEEAENGPADWKEMFRRVLARDLADERQMAQREADYTLARMRPSVSNGVVALPAFTMNTTTVEGGARFLLANYVVPTDAGFPAPAQSYLATFAPSDLPLATAAQLSATFPYVSSTARAPIAVSKSSVHFADGGYYDNDGTASAMEFLRSAMLGEPAGTGKAPLRILLIEIRNSGDVGDGPGEPGGNGGTTKPWSITGQLGAPLLAFWQAGHESTTLRNRNTLALLEQALGDRVEIHRVVFADNNSTNLAGTDPLNWTLTPAERKEVRESACNAQLASQYQEAVDYFFGITPPAGAGENGSGSAPACVIPGSAMKPQ